MSPAARVSALFGTYALSMGVLLVVVPNLTIGLFGLPPDDGPWIRMCGATAIALGLYYLEAGRNELTAYFRISILGRFAFAAVAAGVAVRFHMPSFWLFASVDFFSALATAWFLQRDGELSPI